MSLALGANIRLINSEENPAVQVQQGREDIQPADEQDIEPDDNGDLYTSDDKGNVIKIEHADGAVTISLDGRSLVERPDEPPAGWYANIADKLGEGDLNAISEELIRGIDEDLSSRAEWIAERAEGIKLLGLSLESVPAASGDANTAGGVEGTSRIRHPLLLEACLRFQANARSELLPTDGPVKIRDDNNNVTIDDDQLAECLERDFNHYLTKVAREYYPDTDRMLLLLGFGGMAFKKIYFCPLRSRPVSDTVKADDLIVNENASSLYDAKRITHRVNMTKSTLRRMQLLGVYRDIELGTPMPQQLDDVQLAEKRQQGVTPTPTRPDDRDYTLYECYCDLNVPGYEHKWKGKVSGLDVPWRVTIDVSSRKVLEIVRNHPKPQANELPERRRVFVKYSFVPGFGFHDIGLINILGNTTNAVTAAWRELLDLGMFANFPGFVYSKPAGRQNTLVMRIPPGGGQAFDTQGQDIRASVMPVPYSMQHAPALMTLVDNIAQTGQRLGGTSEQVVGEGKQDAPVGTTLAMIEQAQKLLNAVHKRLHTSQAEEFELIAQCFREHPDSFWQCNKKPAKQWDQQTFLKALDDCNLVPQADPNTASHTQRIIKVGILKQLQGAAPNLYDPIAVERIALQTLGFNNPEKLLAPPEALGKPSPQEEAERLKLQTDAKKADADAAYKQAQAKNMQTQTGIATGKLQLEQQDQEQKHGLAAAQFGVETQYKAKELRQKELAELHQERVQLIDLAQNIAVHPESAALVEPLVHPAYENVQKKQDALDKEGRLDDITGA